MPSNSCPGPILPGSPLSALPDVGPARPVHVQVASGERFDFGANWRRFLRVVDERRIGDAERSLQDLLEVRTLAGKRFLDVGCGSGLFSAAARRLGAVVHSFDYDPQSVACTLEMRRRYAPHDPAWIVEQASVLDREYLARLGRFDVIYSWGVVHHTGAMWSGLANLAELVEHDGQLCVAIYNDQGGASRRWALIKRTYCRSPRPVRWGLIAGVAAFWAVRGALIRLIRRQNPFPSLFFWSMDDSRGMSGRHDLTDWVGGYPFEVAKPEAIFAFYRHRGFMLTALITAGSGHGCNQYVFKKMD